jgi:hypothetical protein
VYFKIQNGCQKPDLYFNDKAARTSPTVGSAPVGVAILVPRLAEARNCLANRSQSLCRAHPVGHGSQLHGSVMDAALDLQATEFSSGRVRFLVCAATQPFEHGRRVSCGLAMICRSHGNNHGNINV